MRRFGHLHSHDTSLLSYASTLHSTTPIPPLSSTARFDVCVVGGGHNGLVASAYLAQAGLKVAVLEKRPLVGGASITEEIHKGFRYSRASYLFSLFRPAIVKELELKRHGLKFYFRHPSSFTPMKDGRKLFLSNDGKFNQKQIEMFSSRDAAAYEKYENMLARLTKFFAPLVDATPPYSAAGWSEHIEQLKVMVAMGKGAMQLGLVGLAEFHEFMTAPASKILDRWFESEPLKSTLATDAVIGAMTSPSQPGSAYVLFHHVMGEVDGRAGAWAYVEGGMGAVSQAIARAAREKGAQIFTNATVTKIDVKDEKCQGVILSNGQSIIAPVVLSNVSPIFTYLHLINEPSLLPSEFRSHIEHIDTTSPVTKINLSLDRLPCFTCMPPRQDSDPPGPEHFGTIHFVENCQQIEQAYQDAQNGRPSDRPVIEMTIPSSLDPTLAPQGKHVVSLFTQYTPYRLKEGAWDDHARAVYANSCFDVIEQFAPGFKSSILHHEVLTPCDLERIFGLSGGNIFHTAMSLDQLYWLRPAPGVGSHRSPIKGLYLCGSGTHPGGGVMGSPGKSAAKAISYDLHLR